MARVSSARSEGSKKPGKPVKAGKKDEDKVKHRTTRAGAPVPPAGPNRVTIALPFSQIRMQEPSVELADLVAVVGDLVMALQDTLTATQFEELELQVDSLQARLR